MAFLIDREISERVRELDLSFNAYGLDKYGISQKYLAHFHTLLAKAYRHYFRVECTGISNVPEEGRALLIGNHSGGLPPRLRGGPRLDVARS